MTLLITIAGLLLMSALSLGVVALVFQLDQEISGADVVLGAAISVVAGVVWFWDRLRRAP